MKKYHDDLEKIFKKVVRGHMSKQDAVTFANGYCTALVSACILSVEDARQMSAVFNAQVYDYRNPDIPAYDPDEPQE